MIARTPRVPQLTVGGEGVRGALAKVIARRQSSWHEFFLCRQRKERPGKWLGETGS